MADGELFAAMHDVGLAEFVAKGLDKKHRRPLVPLDVSGMTAAKAAPFPGPESSYATPRRATCLGIYGNFERHLRHFQAVLGGSRA